MVRSNWNQISLWMQGVWLFILLGGVTVGVTWAGTKPRDLTFERACVEATATVNAAAAIGRMRDLMFTGIDIFYSVAESNSEASMTARLAVDAIAKKVTR